MMYSGPYLLVAILLLLLSYPVTYTYSFGYQGCKKITSTKIREVLVFFILLVFFGLRGFVFTDVFSYYGFFSSIPRTLFWKYPSIGWEPGFILYTSFLKCLNKSYIFYQFISVLIDLILLTWCIKSYVPEEYRIFSFFVFFSFYGVIIEFNLLRNIKAILLFFVAIQYIGKNFFKYCVLILLACTFHKSSIIYLPLYFLFRVKWERKLLLVIYFIGFFIFFFKIDYLRAILLSVSSILPASIGNSINHYLTSDVYSVRVPFSFGFIERFISFLFIYYFLKIKKNNDSSISYENIFFNISFFYFIIFLYFSEITIIIERIPYLFIMGYWICFPLCLKKADKYEKYIFLLYVILMCLLKTAMNGSNVLSKYLFIFQDDYYNRYKVFADFYHL